MFNRLKKFLGKNPGKPSPEEENKAAREWYEHKSRLMAEILGPMHNTVMHAIVPYAIGGGLDLYYYGQGIPGTGVATKELSESPNQGSSNRTFSCYEIVLFTRHPLNLRQAKDKETAFGRAHSNINGILNYVAPFSATASLNENETCEFPAEMESVGGKCLLFDSYGSRSDATVRCFGVLAVIEVFRSEMDFARSFGGSELLARLKASRHYPYSDLDREPVA